MDPSGGNLVQNFSFGSKSLDLSSRTMEACFPIEYLERKKEKPNETLNSKNLTEKRHPIAWKMASYLIPS